MLINKLVFDKEVVDLLKSLDKPSISNVVIPYKKWVDSLVDDDYTEYNMVIDTEKFTNKSGVYISTNNFVYEFFSQVTNWKFVSKRYYAHGTCDNASQILEKYGKVLNHPKRKFVVFLEPVFQEDQKGLSGFKWARTGDYIGIHEKTSDYLEDEEKIKFIFKFLIYEVTEKGSNE